MAFLNRCIWNAVSSGTGSFVVSAAAQNGYVPAGCLDPAVITGATYHYFATNGSDHEEGDGIWTTSTSTLTRAMIRNSSNSGSIVSFAGAPIVFMGGPIAGDTNGFAGELDFSTSTALIKIGGTTSLDYGITNAGGWTFSNIDNANQGINFVQSLTGASAGNLLNIQPTWNTSGACVVWEQELTDTASSGNSFHARFRTNGVDQLKIRKDGISYGQAFSTMGETAILFSSGFFGSADGFQVATSSYYGFTNGTSAFNGVDARFQRNGTNAIEINQGTLGVFGDLVLRDLFTNDAGALIRTKTTLTNGAAASLGTLTNAPAAGNPTKWISIDDNGTTRQIPAW